MVQIYRYFTFIYRTKRPLLGFEALFSAFGNLFSVLGKERKNPGAKGVRILGDTSPQMTNKPVNKIYISRLSSPAVQSVLSLLFGFLSSARKQD
jgi:hypothetical protein